MPRKQKSGISTITMIIPLIWLLSFDMKEKIDGPYPLTEKQIAKLEEIFERY